MNPNQNEQPPVGQNRPQTNDTTDEFPPINVAPPPASMEPLPPMMPAEKKSRKKPVLIVAAAVAVVVLGSAAVFGLWYNKAENVVADSYMKLLLAKSSQGTLSAKISEEGTPTVLLTGDYKQSEAKEISANAKFEIDDNGKKYALDSSLASSKDQTYYVKVDKLREAIDGLTESNPMIGFYTEIFDDVITSVDGKWISISQKDLKELSGEDNTNKELTCVDQKYNEFLKDGKQQDELKKLYQKHMFIKVKAVGSETVDGVYSNKYELTGDPKIANDFANGAKSLTVFKNIDGCLEQDLAKDINDQTKEAVELDEGEKTKVEYWVGVLSHEPVKFKVNSTSKSGNLDLEFKPKLNTKPAVAMPKADKTVLEIRDELEAATNSVYDSVDDSMFEDSTSTF